MSVSYYYVFAPAPFTKRDVMTELHESCDCKVIRTIRPTGRQYYVKVLSGDIMKAAATKKEANGESVSLVIKPSDKLSDEIWDKMTKRRPNYNQTRPQTNQWPCLFIRCPVGTESQVVHDYFRDTLKAEIIAYFPKITEGENAHHFAFIRFDSLEKSKAALEAYRAKPINIEGVIVSIARSRQRPFRRGPRPAQAANSAPAENRGNNSEKPPRKPRQQKKPQPEKAN